MAVDPRSEAQSEMWWRLHAGRLAGRLTTLLRLLAAPDRPDSSSSRLARTCV